MQKFYGTALGGWVDGRAGLRISYNNQKAKMSNSSKKEFKILRVAVLKFIYSVNLSLYCWIHFWLQWPFTFVKYSNFQSSKYAAKNEMRYISVYATENWHYVFIPNVTISNTTIRTMYSSSIHLYWLKIGLIHHPLGPGSGIHPLGVEFGSILWSG